MKNSPDGYTSDGTINLILILGGPGSGKGSICTRILSDPDFQHFTHIGIGDVLRQEMEKKSEDGLVIESCMKDGKLLPWEIMKKNLKSRIDAEGTLGHQWVLLDGFPRMLEQAELFGQIEGYKVLCAVFLNCQLETMRARIITRGVTSNRVDDNAETATKRLLGYIEHTVPVKGFYRDLGRLVEVSSEGLVEETYAILKPLLQERMKSCVGC